MFGFEPQIDLVIAKNKSFKAIRPIIYFFGVISFYIDDLHYNLGVRLLNDKFGIQTRGGCSCAGTYGHFLLHVDIDQSHELTNEISLGELTRKPGWIRLSIHPTTTTAEIEYVCESLKQLAKHHNEWAKAYEYQRGSNEFVHKLHSKNNYKETPINSWFEL